MEHNIDIKKVTKDNTHVTNSVTIKRPKMTKNVVESIKKYCTINGLNCTFLERSTSSLVNEWCAHNLLYCLHIARSRTADVDLDKAKWYSEAVYFVLANIYKLIWKQL